MHLLALRPREEGGDEVDRPVALEDPVGGRREREEDPEDDLERRDRHLEGGVEGALGELVGAREILEAALDREQHLLLDPFRFLGLLRELGLRRWNRLLDLLGRRRDDEVEEQAHQRDERDVVERDPDPTRNPTGLETVDRRAHRRGDDEREKED